jgi:4-amino-4-deoxy-L-arabinose transferase-like glycosyltransferase
MTTIFFARSFRSAFEALTDALLDASRRDRVMLLLLAAYAAAWTLYGAIAKSSQDLHPDMVELIAWSRDPSLGYPKHPPLGAWLVRLWFDVLPLSDWSFYLLAMLLPTLALWIVWRFSADYLAVEKRVAGVALLMLIPFYNFHALKYNANTVLMPAWAATTFVFLRSYRSRSGLYAALAGVGAAVSMLTKYWSVFLLIGLIAAALVDPRRRVYFRSWAPWITIVTGLVVLSPHLIWLYQHDFVPVQYALAKHATHSLGQSVREALSYLLGVAAFAAAPVILAIAAVRPSRATLAEMIWPSDRERRMAAIAFWGPLLLPVVGTLASGTTPTPLWSMSAWALLPVLLLSPSGVKIVPLNLQGILRLAMAEPLVMLIAAPAIAIAIHFAGVTPPAAHGRLLAAQTEQAWRQATAQPLRFVGCDVGNEVIAYAQDRPRALAWRFFGGDIADTVYAEGHGWPRTAPGPSEPSDTQLAESGMALVCSADDGSWVGPAAARAARNPTAKRLDVEVARDFWGLPGQPQRYAIFIIPPRPDFN